MKPTAVYLFHNEQAAGDYKVGLSDSTIRRQIQVRDTYKVSPVIVCSAWLPSRKTAFTAETKWHQHFASLRSSAYSGREWFTLTDHAVDQFTTWARKAPGAAELRLLQQAGKLSGYQIDDLTKRLLNSIPTHERRPRKPV